ncbi:MAG TPA: hypothetical protein VGO07_04765, partial [Candidatus Saccharimonadales bacterium]|nr:hypothetical protein [Candidatus Saccharimonadales bacterium]
MNPENQNGQNIDPLMDDDDRPAGSSVNSTPATAVFAAAPGTTKKKIQPDNEAAIRQELADTLPAKPAIDTSNIYNANARGPRDFASDQTTAGQGPASTAAADPALAAHMPAAAARQKGAVAIGTIIPQIQTYALVMIVLSGLTTLMSAIRFFAATSGPATTLTILSLAIGVLPLTFGIYMLTGKRPAVIKAFLIITGLSYAYSFVNIG